MKKEIMLSDELGFDFHHPLVGAFGGAFWQWYEAHKDDVILSVRFLGIFKIDIEVRELKGFFEKIFGQS